MSETIAEIREFINDKDPWKMDGYHPEDFYYWCCALLGGLDRQQESEGVVGQLIRLAEWFDNPQNPDVLVGFPHTIAAGTALRIVAGRLTAIRELNDG